jgi:hypothetical protein
VLLAASVLERALTDPAAAAHLARAARDLAAWADSLTAPDVALVREPEPAAVPAPEAPRLAARDETRRKTQPRPRPARRTAEEPARDETARGSAPEAPQGIEAKPQKMPRKRAMAVLDTSELVRVPGSDRHSSRWVLRSGETVLGYVQPSYGGASRSGRNGWQALLPGEHQSRPQPTRDAAAVELARKWVALVTSAPRRTITGG